MVCVNAVGYVALNNMTFSNSGPSSIEEWEMCLFPYKSSINCIHVPNSLSGALLLLYIDSNNDIDTYVNVTGATFIDNFSCSLATLSSAQLGVLSVTGGMEIMMTQNEYSVNAEITSSQNNTGFI